MGKLPNVGTFSSSVCRTNERIKTPQKRRCRLARNSRTRNHQNGMGIVAGVQ
jgi:hypothetical protein